MKRIAISGAQNLGKTSFINDILDKYPNCCTTSSTYRDEIKRLKLKCNKDTNVVTQSIILNKLVDDLMCEVGNDTDIFDHVLFDRCICDALIYSTHARLNEKNNSDIDDVFISIQYDIVKYYISYYDKIVFIPMLMDGNDPELEVDGVRDVDAGYRVEIDELFCSLYNTLDRSPEFKDKIVYINGDRETRMKKFEELIMGGECNEVV